jgi:hypothetical protein
MGAVTFYEFDRIFVTKKFVNKPKALPLTLKTMKNVFNCAKLFFPALLLVVLIGGSAWQVKPKSQPKPKATASDTTKPGQHGTHQDEPGVKDLDQAMKELDEAMKKLDEEMKKFDGEKLEKEIRQAMSSIEKVDMKKIQEEIRAAMKKVDWEKIRVDVDKAMKEAEVKMKEIDFSKMEKEMAEMQEKLKAQQLHMKIDGEKIRREVEEGMKKAKEGMEKAREEMKNLKEFTDELEKDGLIDKKKGYKVELKDGDLFINGTKQPKEVTDKYRKYYRKENFTISVNGDSIITL